MAHNTFGVIGGQHTWGGACQHRDQGQHEFFWPAWLEGPQRARLGIKGSRKRSLVGQRHDAVASNRPLLESSHSSKKKKTHWLDTATMRWLAIAPALSTFIIQEPLCASRRLHGAGEGQAAGGYNMCPTTQCFEHVHYPPTAARVLQAAWRGNVVDAWGLSEVAG